MQQNSLINMEHQSHHTCSNTIPTDASNLNTSKLKNKEIVKITPVATKNSTMRLHQQQGHQHQMNNINVLSASQSNQSNNSMMPCKAQTKILTKGNNQNISNSLTCYRAGTLSENKLKWV